jgi:hypothetical protein
LLLPTRILTGMVCDMDMTLQTRHCTCFTVAALMVLGLLLLAPVSSSAATSTIYKCFDKNLGLLYTDEPCQGEQLNVRAGDADPAAVARLERARDALDQSAAQRIVDERRAAAQRDLAAPYAGGVEPNAYDYTAANAPYDDYGVAWGYPGFARHHHPRSRPHRPLEPRRLALAPRQMAPRR